MKKIHVSEGTVHLEQISGETGAKTTIIFSKQKITMVESSVG